MTPDCPPTCRPSESHAGVSDGVTTSARSVETTSLPSTRAASRCHTPSCLSRSLLPTGCFTPCYLAGSGNIPCWVGNYAWCEDGAFNSNEKETMQFLNDRLASYLEKVRGLEEMNEALERRIRERCGADLPLVCPDYQCYFNTIEDLQQKILCTKAENSRLTIQIDNCKLAAEDFRSKYESELTLHQLVEGDIGGLRRILDELSLCKADLEAQVECLKNDLLCLKKNHEEEVNLLRGQLGDRLNVELDSGPIVDLNRVLEEMRCQYETVLASNRRDVEDWFAVQMGELNQQQLSSAEQLQGCQMEILELKRTASALEIELQAQQSLSQLEAEVKSQQLAMSQQDVPAFALELEPSPATPSRDEERGGPTQSLEGTVAETEAQYSAQLAQMQCLIDNVENQLAEIRCDLERQNLEYEVLLDTKARLEGEIATYRGLLESEDCRLPCNPCSTTNPSSSTCEPCPAYVLCTVENHCA